VFMKLIESIGVATFMMTIVFVALIGLWCSVRIFSGLVKIYESSLNGDANNSNN